MKRAWANPTKGDVNQFCEFHTYVLIFNKVTLLFTYEIVCNLTCIAEIVRARVANLRQRGVCWDVTYNVMATYNGYEILKIEQNHPGTGGNAMKWQYIPAQWQRLGKIEMGTK